MSKVLITRDKLDDLAVAVAEKAGLTTPLTLAQMQTAVENLSPGGGTLITKNINANGTYDAEDDNADGYSSVTVNVPTPTPTLQTKTKTYTPTESAQTETVQADSGYDGLDSVAITVNAMPTGAAGTPTATKGSVSNHSVSVTPSVTNTAGYIPGGTKTGTAVTASELVSGSQTLTENGTFDVTNLQSVTVNVSGGTATLVPYVIRPDAELVQSYTFDQHAVADMGLTIPSYTTTAQTLKAAANLSPTVTMDLFKYRYTVVERFLTIPEYSVSTKGRGRQEYTACSYIYDIVKIAANEFQTIIDATKKITSPQYMISTHSLYRLLYWSSSSAIALYTSNSYGAYMTPTPPTVSGSPLTVKAPAFGIRGSTTYYTNTYMNATTDIRYQYVIEVYRSPVGNLNIDGWGQEQSVQHIIDCVNGSTHTLT